ncbi:TIGR04104 family putative zinc finger protein [Alkalibacillus aidingensis]|uniref:TIGR04104 family putative zinc finger protein n=1 Tax=Alkalibacillus aidingensis TaxID=2747607 RepID=UPI00166096F1
MPTCQLCSTRWTWKQTCRRLFTLDTRLTCPHCGETQFLSKKTNKIGAVINLITPFIIIFSSLIFSLSVWGIILVVFSVIVSAISIYPLFTELSNEEEPLIKFQRPSK